MAKILIVDDQPQFRRALHLALAVRGYQTREAAGGAEALELMRSVLPDLILIDWLMPDMDGIRLCRTIRATSCVPIIVLTSRQGGRLEALSAGADDYITKPLDVNILLARIESALSRKHQAVASVEYTRKPAGNRPSRKP